MGEFGAGGHVCGLHPCDEVSSVFYLDRTVKSEKNSLPQREETRHEELIDRAFGMQSSVSGVETRAKVVQPYAAGVKMKFKMHTSVFAKALKDSNTSHVLWKSDM